MSDSGGTTFPPRSPALLGVIHLLPLPTSPDYVDRRLVREAAQRDADALLAGGLDGFVVENFGDRPFHKESVGPAVVAEMTAIVGGLREQVGSTRFVGVNVLRNDAAAALAIAAATGADFIRVNVHTGVAHTDQGVIEGRAADTLRLRRSLDADIAVLADIGVKHSTPPPGFDLEAAAAETAYRGGADGLIVTGPATGAPADLDELHRVRRAVPDRSLWVGSGITAESIRSALAVADGVIVGTWLKEEGELHRPVSEERVRQLVRRVRER